MAASGKRFVVTGGSVAGMASALALARAGLDVVLVERDTIPLAPDPEAAFAATRPGVPQAHFLHAFLARMVSVLRGSFPDVLADLLNAGARLSPPALPGLEEVCLLLARRSTVEWVMRRAVLSEAGIENVAGRTVVGVIAENHTVTGVRLDDGSVVEGSVVACTGRRTDLASWLAPVGVGIEEQTVRSELVYITRWYSAPEFELPASGLLKDLGYLSYLVVPADGGTVAVAVGLPPADQELRSCLLDDRGFDRVAGLLPGLGESLAASGARPLRSSRPMAGLVNRLRRFTDSDGEPLVPGLYAVGDAHTCTNPAYGRGCSLALVGATLLAQAVTGNPDDPASRARAYEVACAREIEPWFHSSVMMDQARTAMRESLRKGEQPARPPGQPDVLGVLIAAGAGLIDDPVVIAGFARLLHLLVTPAQLFGDPHFTTSLMRLMAAPPPLPTGRLGPTRDDLLRAAAAAA